MLHGWMTSLMSYLAALLPRALGFQITLTLTFSSRSSHQLALGNSRRWAERSAARHSKTTGPSFDIQIILMSKYLYMMSELISFPAMMSSRASGRAQRIDHLSILNTSAVTLITKKGGRLDF